MSIKKILFFGKLPPPYTGENVVSASILNLLKDYYSITVVNSSGIVEKKSGIIKKSGYFFNQAIHIIKSFTALVKTIKREKFDYLYFSGSSSVFGALSDSFLVYLSRKHVGHIICHLHRGNYKDNFTKSRLFNAGKFLEANINTFIFLSTNLSEDLKDYIPASKRKVLSNPVDKPLVLSCDDFDLKIAQRATAGKFVITYLSNFILSKGYMDLVEAIKLLTPQLQSKLTVRFIGSWMDTDVEKNIFFNAFKSPPLSNIIQYIGPVYIRGKIKELLIDSDIFCLPTYYPIEAQPVSIIEAMNAGNAIISTWHASIPEYVDHQKAGLLIEKRNIEQLAQAITKLCDRDLLATFSKNARQKFLDNFGEEIVTKNLLEIFASTAT